jgi:hypothetical protein
MARVVITRVPADSVMVIQAPYDHTRNRQETLKSYGCLWRPERKVWVGRLPDLDDLKRSLEHHGDTVTVVGGARSNFANARKVVPGGNWASDLFAVLPPDLGEKAYRALSLVLHPDTGGDARQQQILNDAWSRVRPKAGAR